VAGVLAVLLRGGAPSSRRAPPLAKLELIKVLCCVTVRVVN